MIRLDFLKALAATPLAWLKRDQYPSIGPLKKVLHYPLIECADGRTVVRLLTINEDNTKIWHEILFMNNEFEIHNVRHKNPEKLLYGKFPEKHSPPPHHPTPG